VAAVMKHATPVEPHEGLEHRPDRLVLDPVSRFVADGPATVDGETVDLLPWRIANQHRLVLKPCHGFAGRGVTIGRETTSAGWAEAVDDALAADEAWLAQMLVARAAVEARHPLGPWTGVFRVRR
jgi:hypothetical protein